MYIFLGFCSVLSELFLGGNFVIETMELQRFRAMTAFFFVRIVLHSTWSGGLIPFIKTVNAGFDSQFFTLYFIFGILK
jgi:hypothetical protein